MTGFSTRSSTPSPMLATARASSGSNARPVKRCEHSRSTSPNGRYAWESSENCTCSWSRSRTWTWSATSGSRGVEVHRFCNVTGIIDRAIEGYPHIQRMLDTTEPYLRFDPGAEGAFSVYHTLRLIDEGFDGMIHVKPFGCMPEVTAMSALQRISRERTFPVLFMSYDVQTSTTGVLTRLEAFCDMLAMRRREPVNA